MNPLGVALGLVSAGLVTVVVLWIRGLLKKGALLEQRDAALRVADERITAMEKAAAAARAGRLKELDEKSRTVRTAGDAARLLREQLARTRKPS